MAVNYLTNVFKILWRYRLRRLIQGVISVIFLLWTPLTLGDDISGIWKATKAPIWIDISLKDGVGLVIRNDKYPDRVGQKLLKDLNGEKDEKPTWQGKIYIEKRQEYLDVDVSIPVKDYMVVTGKLGFFSKSIEWQRLKQGGETKSRAGEGSSP